MAPSPHHETGHFYFAQTGHSHFAATPLATKLTKATQPVYDFAFRAGAEISQFCGASGFSLR
jgi:hypothetical protein